MAFVRRLLIIELPNPRLVQQLFPCMRAEIGQQTAKTESFEQELRQELRAEHSNHARAEAMVITLSFVGLERQTPLVMGRLVGLVEGAAVLLVTAS